MNDQIDADRGTSKVLSQKSKHDEESSTMLNKKDNLNAHLGRDHEPLGKKDFEMLHVLE